jgi:hypothetical protein
MIDSAHVCRIVRVVVIGVNGTPEAFVGCQALFVILSASEESSYVIVADRPAPFRTPILRKLRMTLHSGRHR